MIKHASLISLAILLATTAATAQSRVWRCGAASYTNVESEARAQNCTLVEGGNITIVQGTRVANPQANANTGANNGTPAQQAAPQPVRVATAPQTVSTGPMRVDADQQRARDADARAILEAELRKAEARYAELQKEYNNGEPEKQGAEFRNHQKYQDRVAELKASLSRTESDINGLKRELGRTGSK